MSYLNFRLNAAVVGLALLAGTFTTPAFASQKSVGNTIKNGAGKVCNLYADAAGSNTLKHIGGFVSKAGPEGKVAGTAVGYANPSLARKLNPYCWIGGKK